MKISWIIWTLGLSSIANGEFMGMGGPNQEPYCARACRTVGSNLVLSCSHMMHMGNHMTPMTSPECIAESEPFLTSLAYCFKSQCAGRVPLWELEQLWAITTTGDLAVPAKWTYQEALEQLNSTPQEEYVTGETLNKTLLLPLTALRTWSHFMPVMDHNSILLYRYA